MAWNTDMTVILRNMIGDVGTSNEFTDSRLQELLVAAAASLLSELDFTNTYTVDIAATGISPDPTTTTPMDRPFMNLVVLKARCILARSTYRTDTVNGYSIKDGPSSIDGRSVLDARKAQMADACKEYADAKTAYQVGNYQVGEAIVTPFRSGFMSSYNSTVFY